jgi:hypothetical protein
VQYVHTELGSGPGCSCSRANRLFAMGDGHINASWSISLIAGEGHLSPLKML